MIWLMWGGKGGKCFILFVMLFLIFISMDQKQVFKFYFFVVLISSKYLYDVWSSLMFQAISAPYKVAVLMC